jgi:hypothetical protein
MTDIYETADALAVVMEIEAGPKGGPRMIAERFNSPGSAKPRGRLPSDTALPRNDCSLASDRLEASPSRSTLYDGDEKSRVRYHRRHYRLMIRPAEHATELPRQTFDREPRFSNRLAHATTRWHASGTRQLPRRAMAKP